jgi:glucose-1-phosphate cytidylyltransferase
VRAVILAGGLGTRLREETEHRPKPMVEIGERPIIWHIMKMLAHQGLDEFIIALGYKGDQIKDFFINYESKVNDVTVQLGSNKLATHHQREVEESWTVTLANTGALTMTGGRILNIREHVKGERFLCTYGDGLANIDLQELIKFHVSHGKIATVTATKPVSRFGTLEIDSNQKVSKFSEKPQVEQWVNGGFFIFEPEIFNYLEENSILEKEPLENLSHDNELMAYLHNGFWQPMDTLREAQALNELWDNGKAPWRIW